MKLYRIEHQDSLTGMWTHKVEGKLVLDYLSDRTLIQLPMPHSEVFRTGGKVWKTAVPTFELLRAWFTEQDIAEMFRFGFRLVEFDSDEVIIQEMQTLFVDTSRVNLVDITEDYMRGTP